MVITKEMLEILDYLQDRKDYAIFAGFAAYLHVNVDSSADIDIYISSFSAPDDISKDLQSKGWIEKKRKNIKKLLNVVTLEKNSTTFDIIFNSTLAKVFISSKVKLGFKGRQVYVVSREALFIAKLVWLASENRPEHKLRRDKKVVNLLREKLDFKELHKLLPKLKDEFWLRGY